MDSTSPFIKESGSRSSSSNSCNKMNLDSDDGGSISSNMSSKSSRNNIRDDAMQIIEHEYNSRKKPSYDFRERTAEKRSVSRKANSLLPKSKALLRVIDQADEETRLSDLEMRREHEMTSQLNQNHIQKDVPAASWTKLLDYSYQCSKLNPEIELTNFQFENTSNTSSLAPSSSTSNYKTIKRKASEDRFEPYPTSISLKRRAVSPSVSLGGSPVMTATSSPPTSFLNYSPNNNNKKSNFNLYEASGGLSRMSLSE